MRIRAATSGDLPELQAIERAAGSRFADIGMVEVAADDPLPLDVLERYRQGGRAWVAVDDADRSVGYVVVDALDGNAHIEQVSVEPASSRQGIGRALVEHVTGWAKEVGLTAVTLTTFADVEWNAPYYRRLGFQVVDEADVTPGLRERRAAEAAHGLDRWPRVCMRRDL